MKRYLKIFNVFLIFSAIIIFLSLVSYHFFDVFYPHENIRNVMGLLGVDISSYLFANFGVLSFCVPLFLLLSVFSYSVSSAKFVRAVIFGLVFIFLGDVILYALYGINRHNLVANGYFLCGSTGYIFGPAFKYILGRIGVFVVVTPLLIIALYFAVKEFLIALFGFLKTLFGSTGKKDKNDVKKNKKNRDTESKKESSDFEDKIVLSNRPDRESEESAENVVYATKKQDEKTRLPKKEKAEDKEKVVKPAIDSDFLDKKEEKVELKNKEENGYKFPSLELLDEPVHIQTDIQEEEIYKNAKKLEEKLKNFGVNGTVVNVRPGPVITMYEFKPNSGIKISKIANLYNDLAMAMRAVSVRIVAPIPGKAVVGIEISNQQRQTVFMKDILSSRAFASSHSKLTLALGKDIVGNSYVTDLSKMPHLLIAGATGSGKSVAVNSMIVSILYKSTPDEVKFVMIDPKMLELSIYDGIPHMLMPVVVDPKEASGSLAALVNEMETRYHIMSEVGVRNIDGFNAKAKRGIIEYPTMPYIVVVIDELADLMMVAGKKVETHIARLAQMARAAGIHMIVATQRPSVDVLTGLIKANFPARISFKVSSKIDSRTILDVQGAEALLGKGDMLFMQPSSFSLIRIHGAFISDDEIKNVTDFVKTQGSPEYSEELINATKEASGIEEDDEIELDDMFEEALNIIKEGGNPTISYIQRRLKIGYNRAARIVEQMEKKGILSKPDDRGKREILI